jgi:segregation and condensation protein A
MSYRVKIESFEGPFDLLLSLVSESKVDVANISVSEIADQYLATIQQMRHLDMEVASDFLVVASTLLQLKAQAMLPKETPEEDVDEELEELAPDDAREILIARLVAYRQFKNVAAMLQTRAGQMERLHARHAGLEPQFMGLLPDFLADITLHELAVIAAGLSVKRESFLLEADHIAAKPLAVETRLEQIKARLERAGTMSFMQMIEGEKSTPMIVVSFLAMLELYHRGMVDIDQDGLFESIQVTYREEGDWIPAHIREETSPVDEYLERLNAQQEIEVAEELDDQGGYVYDA